MASYSFFIKLKIDQTFQNYLNDQITFLWQFRQFYSSQLEVSGPLQIPPKLPGIGDDIFCFGK